MGYFSIFGVIFLTSGYLWAVRSHEIYVQINTRRPINIISDKYVSFSIDPHDLMKATNSSESVNTEFMVSQLAPAYLRLTGTTINAISESLSKNLVSEEILSSFSDWIREVRWKPIIPLPYSPHEWSMRQTLEILNISNALGLEDCIWQLGTDVEETNAIDYIKDLKTLHTIVDMFNHRTTKWDIVGADINSDSSLEQTRIFTESSKGLVEAIGWLPSLEHIPVEQRSNMFHEREMALRTILNSGTPAWLSLPKKNERMGWTDAGIQFAQSLGDAAQSGFSVVFKPLEEQEIFEPSLSFYISQMFQRIMGEKVFETKSLRGDGYATHVYSHCSKTIPGGIAIMGVNSAAHSTKLITKIVVPYVGPDVWEYIFSTTNESLRLNNEKLEIRSPLEPLTRIRQPNEPISLSLPPKSVGFWVFPQMNVPECFGNSIVKGRPSEIENYERLNPSEEILLQQLVEDAIAIHNRHAGKRHERIPIDEEEEEDPSSDRQKRFLLSGDGIVSEFVDLKLQETANKLRHSLTRELIRNAARLSLPHSRLRRQADNIFRMGPAKPPGLLGGGFPKMGRGGLLGLRQNAPGQQRLGNLLRQPPAGPLAARRQSVRDERKVKNGLVVAQNPVGKGTIEQAQSIEQKVFESRENYNLPQGDVYAKLAKSPEQDYDYVEFDGEGYEKHTQNHRNYDAPDDETLLTIPNAFHESYNTKRVDFMKKSDNDDEIWEHLHKPNMNSRKVESPQQLPQDQTVGYVMRELEPTWNQNKEQLRKAQQDLRSYFMQPVDPNDAFLNRYVLAAGQNGDYSKYIDQSEEDDHYYHTKTATNLANANIKRVIAASHRNPRSIPTNSMLNQNFGRKSDKFSFIKDSQKARNARSAPSDENGSSPESNMITRHKSEEGAYIPRIPFENYKDSLKPKSLEDVKKISKTHEDELINNGGNRKMNPKDIKTFSDSFDHLADLVNHHVTGWWNTWL